MLDLDSFPTNELLFSSQRSTESTFDIDSQTLENNIFDPQDFINIPVTHVEPEYLRQLPILEDTSDNEWKFDMNLTGDSGNKSSWMYSAALNKVFVKINTPLNVYPTFNRHKPNVHLFIRAMLVYSSQNDIPEPVKKCPNHKEQHSSVAFPDHILTCENIGACYEGIEGGKVFKDRLSVVVPLQNVAANEPLKLTFTCQNSCSGMNRKSTSLIFTLEDDFKNVLGRKIMNFKVCSCPRRDKEKDEQTTKTFPKKRKSEGGNTPSTSKKPHLMKQDSTGSVPVNFENLATNIPIKQEQDSQCELKVFLPNEQIRNRALRAVYDVVAGEIIRSGNSAFNYYLNEIQKQIGK